MNVVWHGRPDGSSGPPSADQFNPVSLKSRGFSKPSGGLWTSPQDTTFGWCEWTRNEMPGWHGDAWVAQGSDNLLRLATIGEYDALMKDFGCDTPLGSMTLRGLDYAKLAEHYDGLWMPTDALSWDGGIASSFALTDRLTSYVNLNIIEHGLYGWDCETVLWFRWTFRAWTPATCHDGVPMDADRR